MVRARLKTTEKQPLPDLLRGSVRRIAPTRCSGQPPPPASAFPHPTRYWSQNAPRGARTAFILHNAAYAASPGKGRLSSVRAAARKKTPRLTRPACPDALPTARGGAVRILTLMGGSYRCVNTRVARIGAGTPPSTKPNKTRHHEDAGRSEEPIMSRNIMLPSQPSPFNRKMRYGAALDPRGLVVREPGRTGAGSAASQYPRRGYRIQRMACYGHVVP
jgi:hypothetical protein